MKEIYDEKILSKLKFNESKNLPRYTFVLMCKKIFSGWGATDARIVIDFGRKQYYSGIYFGNLYVFDDFYFMPENDGIIIKNE